MMNKYGPIPDPWTMLAVIGFQSDMAPFRQTDWVRSVRKVQIHEAMLGSISIWISFWKRIGWLMVSNAFFLCEEQITLGNAYNNRPTAPHRRAVDGVSSQYVNCEFAISSITILLLDTYRGTNFRFCPSLLSHCHNTEIYKFL